MLSVIFFSENWGITWSLWKLIVLRVTSIVLVRVFQRDNRFIIIRHPFTFLWRVRSPTLGPQPSARWRLRKASGEGRRSDNCTVVWVNGVGMKTPFSNILTHNEPLGLTIYALLSWLTLMEQLNVTFHSFHSSAFGKIVNVQLQERTGHGQLSAALQRCSDTA